MKTKEVRAHLRLPEGAPGAARQGGRRARRQRAARPRLRDRAAEGLRARGRCARSASPTTAWRLDPTVHPFASGTGIDRHPHHDALLHRAPRRPLRDDARVRARALRAPGRPGARAHAARARRLARHARVAEPHVGEPRRPVAAVLAPLLPAAAGAASPTRSRGYDAERWYREVNAVEPSLIRVEADEATYNLHIILRFELEQAMLADEFPLEQLPEEWNRADVGLPRDRGAERHARRPAGRPLVGRLDRLLPDVRARQPDLRADLGEGRRPTCPTSTTGSSRASSARSATGCASTCTGTAASSRRARRSSASSARPRSIRSRTCATCARSSRRSTASPPPARRRPLLVRVAVMAKTRVGINGFGRIGRNFFRRHARARRGFRDRRLQRPRRRADDGAPSAPRLGARTVPGRGQVEGGSLVVDGKELKGLAERDPANLPWGDLGVDVVIESTGFFTDRRPRRSISMPARRR